MARLARLAVPAQLHYVVQRGHNGGLIAADDQDRGAFVAVLRDAVGSHGCLLHGWALADSEVHLLLTPTGDGALSRTMQAIGRRYAASFNRRHGRSGALWDGRFRAAVVEAGGWALLALRVVDSGAALPAGEGAPPSTSAAHRLGGRRDPALTDPPEYWSLGNTPFEREARYGQLLAEGVSADHLDRLLQAIRRGWAVGSGGFLAALSQQSARPASPRPRGRPRKSVLSV